MKKSKLENILKLVKVVIIVLIVLICTLLIRNNIFKDPQNIIRIVQKYGFYGYIIFILLQLSQVILPVIPGGITNIAGVLLFGGVIGFILNYVGVVAGSIICFTLSRKFGMKLIKLLFKEKTINKYIKYLNKERFSLFLFLTILFPFFPDDLLCYIAGLSNMKTKKFILIIILGKPLSLLFYSIFINKLI